VSFLHNASDTRRALAVQVNKKYVLQLPLPEMLATSLISGENILDWVLQGAAGSRQNELLPGYCQSSSALRCAGE